MDTYQEDSTDDEIGMNLQLAERLSINRGEHVSSNNKSINRRDNKHLCSEYKNIHFHDEHSSSSSSLEMHNDPSISNVSSAYSLHNKKRQNGDKTTEQLANPKRTCLSDRLGRSQEARDHKSRNNGETSHSSKLINFPSQPDNLPKRNIFPDNTYEDHLNKFSDGEDSDFQPWQPFPRKKTVLENGESSKALPKYGPSNSIVQSPLEENRDSLNHSVQFIDSTSDDDSRTVMQNGSLKGGRQSPELMSFKKVLGRKVKKVLDSEDTDDDDDNWPVNYRDRRLLFLSSDSDDSRPSNKNSKTSETTLKKSNFPFSSGEIYNSNTCPISNPMAEPFDHVRPIYHQLEPTTSSYRGRNRSNKSCKTRSSNRAERIADLDRDYEFPSHNTKEFHTAVGESHSRGPTVPHSRTLRSHRREESNKSTKSRSYTGANSSKEKSHRSHHQDFLDVGPSNRSNMSPPHSNFSGFRPWEDPAPSIPFSEFQAPVDEDENNTRRRAATLPRTPRNRRRSNTSKSGKGRTYISEYNEACSRKGKSNLASRYPDLFDAEDSSEVEFFTANSYSDTESNTESLNNLRRINPMHRNSPVQIQEVNCDSINVGSSEDEISVVFTSGPHPRNSDQRRGASRTLGRRGNRGSRRLVSNTQDVVSLSPDPVEQVRQMEEDERFARMLQAQFDAEIDPTYSPHVHTYVCHPPDPSHITMRESTSSDDSIDLQMEPDFNSHSQPERFFPVTNPLAFMPTVLPRRGGYRARRPRRRNADMDARINIARFWDFHATAPLANLFNYESSDENYEAFLGLADLNGDVTHGLQKSEINRLPTRKYIAPNTASSSNGADLPHKRAELNKECQVCLSDYANGDVLRILPCFHEFHTPCIDPWLKINHTCPVCRVIVDLGE